MAGLSGKGAEGRLFRERDTPFAEWFTIGTRSILCTGFEVVQDIGGGSSEGRHNWMPIDVFIIVEAARLFFTSQLAAMAR